MPSVVASPIAMAAYWATDPPTLAELHLWGGSIAAVQAGVIKQQ